MLHDGDTIESAAGVDAAGEGGQGQAHSSALNGEQQALTLGRLKEFYLDTSEPVASGAQAAG